MSLRIYNTLRRSVETFIPRDSAGKKVGVYCCGPTIHDFAHIGNYRTFVFADLVRRFLEFRGYEVTHVMNITDVEDKIISRVRQAGTSLRDYTSRYEQAFREDLRALNCRDPHLMPRATEHVPEMVTLIERLMARKIAYQAQDGSVYFSIEHYRGCGCQYGQLVNLNLEEMRAGERVKSDEYAKESVADFALWKKRMPEDGEVFWPSPWGEGRPGWHIECSAMSMKYLGESFDLHLGGEDLAFPHHEDEIAQSEGAALQKPGEPFVKYWMHGAHLLVEGKKMSKSLGNFYTLRDLLEKGYSGREVRYLLLSGHYRESFNFTLEGLNGARTALARIDECLSKLREIAGTASGSLDVAHPLVGAIGEKLDEDLNISAAWGAVFDWVRETNRELASQQLSPLKAANDLKAWEWVDQVLGLGSGNSATAQGELAPELQAMLEERVASRKAKNFARADQLRDELKARGWVIEDTPKGARLKKA